MKVWDVAEYRRGIVDDAWQRLWHFNDHCTNYPTRNFEVTRFRPSDDDLCAKCASNQAS